MEFYVGTSGWFYPWNEKRSLEWYTANSGLNAIELNASFYRFPSPTAVKSWARKAQSLRWSIKVNRSITHNFKFTDEAFPYWERFCRLFKPLEANVDFFLFQLPPSLTPESTARIEKFLRRTELGGRFALEVRNREWFSKECEEWAGKIGLTLVSLDSPELPRAIFKTSGVVYVRMHGREAWYAHDYSPEELSEVAKRIVDCEPRKAYVFFNNDHSMLENSRRMLTIFKQRL